MFLYLRQVAHKTETHVYSVCDSFFSKYHNDVRKLAVCNIITKNRNCTAVTIETRKSAKVTTHVGHLPKVLLLVLLIVFTSIIY